MHANKKDTIPEELLEAYDDMIVGLKGIERKGAEPSLRAGSFSLPLAFESKLSTLVKTKMPLTGL